MSEHDFCRLYLAEVRRDAKKAGVDVPKGLSAYVQSYGRNNPWAVVYANKDDSNPHVDQHGIVWEGTCCCAWDARSKAIESTIPKDLEESEA